MNWPDPADAAKQTSFARFIGVSQQAVSQMCIKGVLPEGGSYGEWLQCYLDRLRSEASGRDQDERLSTARIRDTEMAANLKEMEYLERLKKIIWVDDIFPMVQNLCSAIQFNVMAAQERIIEAIESKHAIKLDDEDVGKPLRAALESVAGSTAELERMLAQVDCDSVAPGSGSVCGVGAEVSETAVGE